MMRVMAQIDTVTFDGAASISGNRVPVAFYVQPGSERYEVRIDRDHTVAYFQPDCSPPAGVATIFGGTGGVAGRDHRYDLPAGEVTAAARGEPLGRGRSHFDNL